MRGLGGSILTIVALLCASCATETIVYHTVPEWQLREGVVPREYRDQEGVLHINRPREVAGLTRIDPDDPEANSGRTTDDQGNVSYHALVPEQVLSATLELLIEEDYEAIWEQVVSKHTHRRYEQAGGGFDEFAAFMARNRNDLYKSLNRMAAEVRQPAVVIEPGPMGGQRMRFHRHFAREYKFSTVDTVWEDGGLKLLMIHPTNND